MLGSNTSHRNMEIKKIFGNKANEKNQTKAFIGNTNDTSFLKFNAMYFATTGDYQNYTRTYFEVYTTYMMVVSTVEQIKNYIDAHRDQFMNTVEIKEKINTNEERIPFSPSSTSISNLFVTSNISEMMTKENTRKATGAGSNAGSNAIQLKMNKYLTYPTLLQFEKISSSQTLFQTLVERYVPSNSYSKSLLELIRDYNLYKTKLLKLLTNKDGTTFNYGLLAFGFLFATPSFFPLRDDITHQFINPKLYDIGRSDVNVESEAKRLTKVINTLGSEMMEKVQYFYNESYQNVILYEALHSALDLDLAGVRFVLHYVHPDFLLLFLKRKEVIDKQMYGYLSSFEMGNIEHTANEKNISIMGDLFKEQNGLFLDFNTYYRNMN